ncbi:MFS transporter [Ancylobacter sonchi]|uniref:MFS transporter n=1 Tax=Ancylobacter sonchi TaxID=1937790 RepID=UPI001BD37DF2|nr:MFS transporter [Ancylobacter sonchi]MBS7535198.1 MFS transporter [Ancylobacter sonchi]
MPDPGRTTPATSSRPFILYAAGQAVSSTGSWMQRMAIGWLAWELTQSVAWIGAIALTELVAALWVAPLAGVITDRSNPYRLNLLFQCCGMVVTLTLFAVTVTGAMTIELLWLLALADASWQGLSQPARAVAIGFLADRRHMARAVAANSIAFNIARAAGPALGGFVIVHAGTAVVFLVDGASFAVLILVLARLRAALDRPGAASGRSVLQDFVGGYRYIARTPAVATVFLLAMAFSVLGRPFTELFPAIAGDMLGGGPGVLSTLMSLQGVGALVGGSWMLRRRSTDRLVTVTYLAGIGMAGALVAFCLVGDRTAAFVLVALAGLCHVMCNIGMQSLAQLFSDSMFRGRTMALYGLIFRTGPAASAALIGIAAGWLGLPLLIGIAAALCAASLVAIGLVRRHAFADGPAEAGQKA